MAGFGGDVAESRQRFQETLEVLINAWTREESFTYDGEHVNISRPVTVFPKPLQKPYPPFLLMGTSVESMRVAAQLDMLARVGEEGGKSGQVQFSGAGSGPPHHTHGVGRPPRRAAVVRHASS
jgi:alkanesulfonate monooxygenase SsuD/methylene tetrahydromethanopterin reductase-like flavin-dependent oxidoreductase (luciferase family)